jgi:hypothetical protein
VLPVVDRLQILTVETTALFAAGTVYNVVVVAAAGFCCPNTLYTVGILYAPINRNGSKVLTKLKLPAPFVIINWLLEPPVNCKFVIEPKVAISLFLKVLQTPSGMPYVFLLF